MITTLSSAGRMARQVVTGLRDLVELVRWARRSRDRKLVVTSSSVTLPDF
jgi:hypothetical protein